MITLAQETTTLAEGATLSVLREINPKSGIVGTYLVAARDRAHLRMRVDDIAPGSMRLYLNLVVREIQRERALIIKAPETPMHFPVTIRNFVHNMAHAGMFIFETLTNADSTGNTGIPKSSRKISKQRKRQNHQQDTG